MTQLKQPACVTCASLGNGEMANTGRGEYLSDAWGHMVRCGLGNDVDLGRCPECDACFEWQDHPQHYGSGNLDEEHLRRLPDAEAELVRALLLAASDAQAPARVIEAALTGVGPDLLRVLLADMAIKYKAAFRPLLPTLVDRLFREPGLSAVDRLSSYVGSSLARAQEMIARIEADPRPRPFAVELLLTRCRAVRP